MGSVAVVGAGIVGAAVARAAAVAGADVTLVEAGRPGGATSGTSLAWINSNAKLPRGYHDLSVRAMAAWRRWAADLGGPDWYRPTGNLTWAVDGSLVDTVARLRDWGYPVTEPHPGEVAELEPRLRVPAGAHVAYFPDEAFVHPEPAVAGLVAAARAAGARLLAGGGAAAFELTGSRVTGLRLGDGTRVHADTYVCCAGVATPDLLRPVGVELPLVPGDAAGSAAPGVVAHVATGDRVLSRVVHAPDLSLRPAAPGGLRMDAGDVNDRVDAGTPAADLDRYGRELYDRARRILTGLPPDAPVTARLCVRPLPVDGWPIVGFVHDGVYVVVGHSGVTLAALLGELTAAEVVGGELAGADGAALAPYRPGRFG